MITAPTHCLCIYTLWVYREGLDYTDTIRLHGQIKGWSFALIITLHAMPKEHRENNDTILVKGYNPGAYNSNKPPVTKYTDLAAALYFKVSW